VSIGGLPVRLQGKTGSGAGLSTPEGAITMKYLILLYADQAQLPEPGTAELAAMMAEWAVARQAMSEAGVLIECAPLQPPSASTTVRVRGGETLVTDGPAAEIKEVFGGITLIECDGLDDALKWAATLPTARAGSVEVRPLVQVSAVA
jgi:hypothetical protein